MNRHDRRAARAKRPPSPERQANAAATRARIGGLLDLLKAKAGPDLGFVLITAPNGTEFLTMEHVATGTNMPRAQAAQLMTGILDYWQGQGVEMPSPDLRTVQLMRSLLGGLDLSSVPPLDVARKAVVHGSEVVGMLTAGAQPERIWTEAVAIACEWLAIAASVQPKRPAPEGVPVMPPDEERLSLFRALRLEIERNAGKWPPGNTKETLVSDLLAKPASADRDKLIEFARLGLFHDFDSELALPKLELLESLGSLGYDDLARKLREGGYDNERPTVEQREEMRAYAGADFFDTVIEGGKPRPVS